jgi:hypothetical protein
MNKPAEPNSFRTGPDEQGMFGIFGGRFVAETLMPLILDLQAALGRGEERSGLQGRAGKPQHPLHRPAVAALFRRTADRASRRREDLLQARRAEPHRLAQDQQLPRPDPAGAAHGQDPHHRRDRRRPARRGFGHRLGPLRLSVPCLYGRDRCRAAGAERVPHEAARRGGDAGHLGPRHAEGRDERGAARLGDQCRGYLLPDRHGGRTASLSGDGARLPVGDRHGNERTADGGRRPAAGHDRRRRRRRLERDRPVPSVPRRQGRADRRRRSRRQGSRRRGALRLADGRVRRASCMATAPICCRTATARSRTAIRSRPASTIRASGRNIPG